MSLPYIQSTMQSARVGADSQVQYPFLSDGDTQTKVYRMRCQQIAEYYNPAQVALDTPMTSAAAAGVIALPFGTDSSAYYVGDENLSPQPGGMIQFDRIFANIPQTRSVPEGTQIYTFPGIEDVGEGFYAGQGVIDSAFMVQGIKGVYLNISSSTFTPVVGDLIWVQMSYKIGSSDEIFTTSSNVPILELTNNATTYRVDIGLNLTTQTNITVMGEAYSLNKVRIRSNLARPALTLQAPVTSKYEFFLPGVTTGVSSLGDVVVPQKFSAVYAAKDGIPQLLGNAFTENITYPSSDEYRQMVEDNTIITIESGLQKWKGNIYVLKTKTTKAQ